MATSPVENSLVVACGACGARFRAQRALAGKSRPCPRCGEAITIPHVIDEPTAPRDASEPAAPALVGFECDNCQTRLTARSEYAGRKLKCPDCGAKTVIPAPVIKPRKKTPAAMLDEQYEVWPVDAAPTEDELLAVAPPSVSFVCSLCDTRLTAAIALVGEPFTCPDCGAKTPVPPPSAALPSKWKTEIEGYELDEAFAPTDAPAVVYPDAHERAYEELERKTPKVRRPDKRESAESDIRWPLLSGVFTFPFASGAVIRQCALAIWLMVIVSLFGAAMESMFTGVGRVAGGGALMGVPLLVGSVILGAMWFAAISACWMTIVKLTSDGVDHVESWPDALFIDWMFEGFFVGMAAAVSAFPFWAASRLTAISEEWRVLIFGGCCLITFPIVLLSQLENESPWAVLSPRVLASLIRTPVAWFFFYIESFAIAALLYFGVAWSTDLGEWALLIAPPFVVIGTFIYFRLLGRLGWCLVRSASLG